MGYRSDVSIAFYTLAKDKLPFAALKLWFDENYAKTCPEPDHIDTGDDHIVVQYHDWKWYESYPEIRAVNAAMYLFDETFDTGNSDSHAAREFVRVGEQSGDVEEDRSDYHEYRLTVQRSINFE
jgi:hypothetical protein